MTADAESIDETSAWPITDDGIRQAFAEMLVDGSWGRYHGPHCDRLRTALADFHSVDHIHLCSSGTSAVELALRCVPVHPGDEVILAAYDYKASIASVLTVGAVPVLVDTLPGVPVIDHEQLGAAVSDKTRAIICSHLHGSFAPMDSVMKFAAEHNLTVIEDACQASGAVLDGRPVGSWGDVGLLSFGGSKLMTSGRGGAVLTSNPTLAQRMRLYTQRGNDAYPLSEMQAAVLLPQLQQLPNRTQQRYHAVERLLDALPDDSLIEPALHPDPRATSSVPAYYKVAFRLREVHADSAARDAFVNRMRNRGVPLNAGFFGLHLTHSRKRFRAVGDLPNATELHHNLMTLHHPVLLSPRAESLPQLMVD